MSNGSNIIRQASNSQLMAAIIDKLAPGKKIVISHEDVARYTNRMPTLFNFPGNGTIEIEVDATSKRAPT